MTKVAALFNSNGVAVNVVIIDNDIPDGYTYVPFQIGIGQTYKEAENSNMLFKARVWREEAYRNEADPLFFQAQRGKATQQEWLDKIAEIEARFPYPEV